MRKLETSLGQFLGKSKWEKPLADWIMATAVGLISQEMVDKQVERVERNDGWRRDLFLEEQWVKYLISLHFISHFLCFLVGPHLPNGYNLNPPLREVARQKQHLNEESLWRSSMQRGSYSISALNGGRT
jgi:hypothetical protein